MLLEKKKTARLQLGYSKAIENCSVCQRQVTLLAQEDKVLSNQIN